MAPRPRSQVAAAFAVSLSLVLANPAAAVTATGRLQIIQLDVGQGDGAVIISPLGEVVMIDNGVLGNPTPAMGVKVPNQLQALGVTSVAHHFASHYHSDHIGLFTTIFGAGGVASLGYGWDRGGSYTTATYTNYVNTVGNRRRTLAKDQVITLDSLSAHPVYIKCVDLNAPGSATTDENSNCLVLKVSYGEFDMSFGGDLPGATTGSYTNMETTIGPMVGPIEAYKVHHHGSASSSHTAWLTATDPQVAVVSAGTGNSYGHPTAAAMNRLHAAGTRVYWTETGSGATPLAGWDKVSNGQVIISATWEPAGVDTIRGNGFTDTFINSGTPIAMHQLAVATEGQGSVVVTPSLASYPHGTPVELDATAELGWAFAGWTGDYTGSLDPLPVTMNADVNVTARFVDVAAPVVEVVAPNGGEELDTGEAGTITWNAEDNVGVDSVQVELSLTGENGPWLVVAHGLPNTGSTGWTAPEQATDSAFVRVTAFDHALNAGLDAGDAPFRITAPIPVAVGDAAPTLALAHPSPNPSRGEAVLRFTLPRAGRASLELVDVTGRRVWGVDTDFPAGAHALRWSGAHARSGLYFVRLVTPWGTRAERLVLLKE